MYGACTGTLFDDDSSITDQSGNYSVVISNGATFLTTNCLHMVASASGIAPTTRSGITYEFQSSPDTILIDFIVQ